MVVWYSFQNEYLILIVPYTWINSFNISKKLKASRTCKIFKKLSFLILVLRFLRGVVLTPRSYALTAAIRRDGMARLRNPLKVFKIWFVTTKNLRLCDPWIGSQRHLRNIELKCLVQGNYRRKFTKWELLLKIYWLVQWEGFVLRSDSGLTEAIMVVCNCLPLS